MKPYILVTVLCQAMLVHLLPYEAPCILSGGEDLSTCEESSIIILESGQNYTIKDNFVVSSVSEFRIEGNNSMIQCGPQASLVFTNISQLFIADVVLSSCGSMHETAMSRRQEVILFQVAVYVRGCLHVSLDNIIIKNSRGVGLALVHSVKSIEITDSVFMNNSASNNVAGGGGVYIEGRNASTSESESLHVELSRCSFVNNNASTELYRKESYLIYQRNTTDFPFGKGGGLSIYLHGALTEVNISNCSFDGNDALRGGGLFVIFFSKSQNNSVVVTGSSFVSNKCTVQDRSQSYYSAGGGVAVAYLASSSPNTVHILNTTLDGNEAYYGGGLSVTTTQAYDRYTSSLFLLKNSTFTKNSALIGSACDFFCNLIFRSGNCHGIVKLQVKDIRVDSNQGKYNEDLTCSTVNLKEMQAEFFGDIIISDNQASGIELDDSTLNLTSNARVQISKNSARNGGGMSLQGRSEIILHSGVELLVADNIASETGGGMYVFQVEQSFAIHLHTCFINRQYESSTVNVTFSGNSADGRPNAIFASSILPCVTVENTINSTFCDWEGWNFHENCTSQIRTLPNRFGRDRYDIQVYPSIMKKIGFSVLDDFNHDITDETKFITCISAGDHAIMIEEPVIVNNSISIASSNKSLNVTLQTDYHRSVSTTLNVTLMDCPVGYHFESSMKCECSITPSPELNCVPLPDVLNVSVFIGHCVGYGKPNDNSNSSILQRAKCPFTANRFESIVSVGGPRNEIFNENFCGRFNRTGLLCFHCKDGFGIEIFSPTYKCRPCNNSNTYANWAKAISVITVPQTVFCFIVIVFHIGITAPTMNGYIFFSHVITLPLEILVIQSAWSLNFRETKNTIYPVVLTDILMDPYRIWSFDYPEIFRVTTCLYEKFRIMDAIAFRYIHALFPILIVLLTLMVIELHARNCKPVVYLWKPLCFLCIRLRRKWEVKTSVIDAFATVVLLSYSKIINTSLYLLTFNYVHDENQTQVAMRLDYDTSVLYFKNDHVIFASIAIIMLCTFGVIPPLLLLLYPSQWFYNLLGKLKLDKWHGLHVFVETFHGSFKNRTNGSPERRWFAGLYFIFRIIVFLTFAFTNNLNDIHFRLGLTYMTFLLAIIILRPYKNNFYTYLDAMFFAILAIINFTVVYCIAYLQANQKLPKVTWHLTYALAWIPNLYLALYLLYLACARSRSTFIQTYFVSKMRRLVIKTSMFFVSQPRRDTLLTDYDVISNYDEPLPTHSSLESLSDAPDRVDNPYRYFDMERSTGTSYSVVSVDRDKDKLIQMEQT